MKPNEEKWPVLHYEEVKDTLDTLHMCMQIVGKVKLELCPFINQWWEVAFYVTASGMTTGRIPYGNEIFEVDFDFITHNIYIRTSSGQLKTIPLIPRPVSDFYKEFINVLEAIGIKVSINPLPSEVPDPIPCHEDTKHTSYDKEYVTRWWHILVRTCILFDRFRSPFYGKNSPVHFFWGGFDLAATRFSGKPATPPRNDIINRFGENQENFAYGFWAGNSMFHKPAFYSYLYPAPKGIEAIKIKPGAAYYNKELSIFILPYEDIHKAAAPEKLIMEFLNSTYNESVQLAGWDIKSLEGPIPGKFA
jgi:hypothetical protein